MATLPDLNRPCDQCAVRKVKCTRNQPICSCCVKRKLLCTNTRVTKVPLKRNMKISNNLNMFKIQTIPNRSLELQRKICSNTNSPFVTALNDNVKNCKVQRLSSYFLYLLEFPSFKNKSRDLEIYFKTLTDLNRHYKPKHVDLRMNHDTDLQKPVLIRAFKAYFQHANIVFPIFTRKYFFSKKRSELIKLCIYLIGLHFLDRTLLVKQMIESLETMVYRQYLKDLHKISTQRLQITMLMLNYCQYSIKFASHVFFFYGIANSMMSALALDRVCKIGRKDNFITYLEDNMLYNTFLFYKGLFSDAHNIPLSINSPSTYNLLSDHFLKLKPNSVYDLVDYCEVVMNDYSAMIAPNYALISKLRFKITHQKESSESIKQGIDRGIALIHQSYLTCMSAFVNYQKTNKDQAFLPELINPYLLLVTQQLSFSLKDLYLLGTHLNPDRTQLPSLIPTFSFTCPYYQKFIACNKSIILTSEKLGSSTFYFVRITMLQQAVFTLLRHLKMFSTSPLNSKHIIDTGFVLLDSFLNLPLRKNKIHSSELVVMQLIKKL